MLNSILITLAVALGGAHAAPQAIPEGECGYVSAPQNVTEVYTIR